MYTIHITKEQQPYFAKIQEEIDRELQTNPNLSGACAKIVDSDDFVGCHVDGPCEHLGYQLLMVTQRASQR